MKPYRIVLLVAAVLSLVSWLIADQSKVENAAGGLDGLRSLDQNVRIATCRGILDEQQKTIHALMELLKAMGPDGNWLDEFSTESLAIKILGEMRAVEAVPLLMKWATPPTGPEGYSTWSPRPRYMCPAGLALAKIGKGAEPALIEALNQDSNKPLWGISLGILREIEPKKCLEVILTEAMKNEQDAKAKVHYAEAIAELKKTKSDKIN